MHSDPMREWSYRPRSEREVRDEEIFASLDPAWPGVEAAVAAYRDRRMDDAKRELLSYFRRRQQPHWFYDGRGKTEDARGSAGMSVRESTAEAMADADRLVRRKFLGGVLHDMGERWDRFPLFDLNGDEDKPLRVTANRFVRMNFIKPLLVAYDHTRNPEYAETLAAMLKAFTEKLLEEHPYVPDPVESAEAYTIHYSRSPFRSNMSVAQSALNIIHLMHTDLFDSQWLSTELSFRLFRYAWYVMSYHRSYDKNRYRHYNHHLFERGTAPIMFSVMFPEFPHLRPLLERGKEVVDAHFRHDYHESGGYDEHSMAYTCSTTLSEFLFPVTRLLELNGLGEIGEEWRRPLDRVCTYYSGLVMPDGRFPDVGDAGGGEARPLLEQGADRFGSQAAQAVLQALGLADRESEAAAESALPPLAASDPPTGYLWARERWTPDSSYMLMCNKIFTRHCAHNHVDMLSLILAVRGETLIGEPLARTLYKYVSNASALDDYLRGLGSHNTVLVHGQAVTKPLLQRQQRMDSQTVRTEAFDCKDDAVYVRASHRADLNGSHTREVLFVHRAGWLIADTIGNTGSGNGQPHVQRWHLEHGVSAERMDADEHALVVRGRSSRLLCVWPAVPAVGIRLWKQEPVLAIGSVPNYKAVSDLPWIVDVAFGPAVDNPIADGSPCRLPCIFVDVTDAAEPLETVVVRCRTLLERVDSRLNATAGANLSGDNELLDRFRRMKA